MCENASQCLEMYILTALAITPSLLNWPFKILSHECWSVVIISEPQIRGYRIYAGHHNDALYLSWKMPKYWLEFGHRVVPPNLEGKGGKKFHPTVTTPLWQLSPATISPLPGLCMLKEGVNSRRDKVWQPTLATLLPLPVSCNTRGANKQE